MGFGDFPPDRDARQHLALFRSEPTYLTVMNSLDRFTLGDQELLGVRLDWILASDSLSRHWTITHFHPYSPLPPLGFMPGCRIVLLNLKLAD